MGCGGQCLGVISTYFITHSVSSASFLLSFPDRRSYLPQDHVIQDNKEDGNNSFPYLWDEGRTWQKGWLKRGNGRHFPSWAR